MCGAPKQGSERVPNGTSEGGAREACIPLSTVAGYEAAVARAPRALAAS
jgi:hypothetical protein